MDARYDRSPLADVGFIVTMAVTAILLLLLLADNSRGDGYSVSSYSAATYSVGSVADGYVYQSDGYWHRSGNRYTRTLTPYTYRALDSYGCWKTFMAWKVVYDQVYVAPKAYEPPKYEDPQDAAYREATRAFADGFRRSSERKARNEKHNQILELYAAGRQLFGDDYTPRVPGDGGFFRQQYGSHYAEQQQVLTKREYRRIDVVDPNPLARALANSLKTAEENVNLAGDRARGAFKDAVDSTSVVAERQASAQLLEAQALLERERGASDERRLRASASERQTLQTETHTQSVVPRQSQQSPHGGTPASLSLDSVIASRCLKCHSGDKPSRDLDLSGGLTSFSEEDQKRIVRSVWQGKMPLVNTKPVRLPISEVMAFLGGMTLDDAGKAAFIQELTEGK